MFDILKARDIYFKNKKIYKGSIAFLKTAEALNMSVKELSIQWHRAKKGG